jgi:hypothetical protein
MRRRDFVKAIITSAAGWPLLTRAQQRTTPVSPVLGQPTMDGIIVKELFGVSHPDQILMLSATLNPATQKLMKDGTEVSYQVDGSKILVRAAGGIAANSTHVWTIAPGARSAAAQVTVTDGGTYYEIDNGIIAFRTPKTISVSGAVWATTDVDENRIWTPNTVLGPIQGIRHIDGTWTGTGPNYVYSGQTWTVHTMPPTGSYEESPNYPATSATVTVLENGPLRAKIKVAYVALRPAQGGIPRSDTGYFNCILTLEAGQRCIMVEQETDGTPSWSVNMNTGVNADRARYRGHYSYTIAQGHNYDGTIYRPMDARPSMDAEVNLADTGARNYDWSGNTPFDGVWYPYLYAWFTWEPNTGWYWHAYNSAGGSNSNVWGIFQGPASKWLGGAMAFQRFGVYGKPAAGVPTELGFWAYPGHSVTTPAIDDTDRKQPFGIFLGSKGADIPVDFSASYYYPINNGGEYSVNAPGIAKVFNLHSGTAQFYKQIDQGLDFPDPVGGFPGMYLTRTDMEALITNIENNQGPGSVYEKLYTLDTQYRDLWDAFADVTNVKASAVVTSCFNTIRGALDIYNNVGEIHAANWKYWTGATEFQALAVRTSALISLDQHRPFLTADQRRTLKAVMSMVGHIAWDNDFAPMDNWQTFTMGTANMPIQYVQARNQIAAILNTHPQFSARFATVYSSVSGSLASALDTYGSPKDCPHYAGATVIPTTDVLRQLQVAGYQNEFAPGSTFYNRLVNLGEWCMQILSPKQARFGNLRKMFSFGDGASEGHDQVLSLIMGFEASNLTLSKRMAAAWADMGQPMGSFYASSGLKIRPGFPTQDPALGDADFPGYMTVMRSGWNTANESAVILPHGDSLVDHSTFQRGSPSIYLLGAPVCISFGSMYTPKIDGPWVSCSTYIATDQLGYTGPDQTDTHTWDTATDLNFPCGIYSDYIHDTYVYTPTTNRVDLTMTFAALYNWVRHITYYRDVISAPVVRLRDSNTEGGDAIFTLHMMAQGAVTKPDGSTITPATLTGTPFNISNGACFKFIGQWGVSWDVYYFGPPAQAFIGVYINTWAPSKEQAEYSAANGGQPFQEKQYLLRIKTAGPCDVVVVPYFTGKRPANLKVVQVAGGLRVDPASRTLAN